MTERTVPAASKARAIADEVRRRIAERAWSQGERIPDEATLAREFGVARATVNKALQALADEGLLARRRKGGTHVAVNPARRATLSIPIVREQIEAMDRRYSHRLVLRAIAPLPGEVAARMRLAEGLPLLHLRTVHCGDGVPFQAEDRWVNLNAALGAEATDFSQHNANEWLVRNFPWLHADIGFSAENATEEDAALLDTSRGTALLIVHRTTWNDIGPITAVRLAFQPGHVLAASG